MQFTSSVKNQLKGSLFVSRVAARLRTRRERKDHPHGIVPDRPRRVIVEPTNACNLACSYCGNKSMDRRLTMLPMPLYAQLIEEMQSLGIDRLTLHTIGEPTLHRELPKMISMARAAGIQVSVSTNGTRLTPEYVRELVAAGPDIINLSIDAADPEKIKALRPGLDPEAFYRGMKELKAVRDAEGPFKSTPWGRVRVPSIVATCVVTKAFDAEEERAWFERYRDHVDDVDLHWPNSHAGYAEGEVHGGGGRLARFLGRPIQRLRDRFYRRMRISCPYPWDALFLLSNGQVSACHFDFDARLVVGRFGPSSIEEIWKSEEMQSIRKAHMNFDFQDWEQCGDCSAALYTNRHQDDLMSRRVKRRNRFVPTRDMWTGRAPDAQVNGDLAEPSE
ncbi:Cyclic pyranopterin monophosphate synthase [Planctomycetes bacterium Poly30]|uniref:Cyclic pyranopterin monophosphate synthase n=1 Tax=Saltatorellus ferox TaxID=2528018 RepID=A0A518EQV0_9BACT|nr:Cyclic pyranopterin monophosphate synthase [Planctomycetes bacterium Poly30]